MPVRRAGREGGAGGEGGGGLHLEHLPPSRVFFSGCRKRYGPLLDYCDLKPTSAAGAFLAQCGVRDAPTVTLLAAAVAANHERFTSSLTGGGVSPYLAVLKELAAGLKGAGAAADGGGGDGGDGGGGEGGSEGGGGDGGEDGGGDGNAVPPLHTAR